MKILFSDIALQELANIKSYIKRDSEYYSRVFVDKILATIKKLGDFPCLGRVVPETNREDIRELIYRDYRIVYKCKSTEIIILTVIHGSRELRTTDKEKWIIT